MMRKLSEWSIPENADTMYYLRDDSLWLDSKSSLLTEDEKEGAKRLMKRVRDIEPEMITHRFMKRICLDYLSKQYFNSLSKDRRQFVKCIYYAVVIRDLILRLETTELSRHYRLSFLSRYPFLQDEEGTETELLWLFQFERALRYTQGVLNPSGNKRNYIDIATHLQGSDVFTQYIAGGSNPPQTRRRIKLFTQITGLEPKKREKRKRTKILKKRGRPRKKQNEDDNCSSSSATSVLETNSVPSSVQQPILGISLQGNYEVQQYTYNFEKVQGSNINEQANEADLFDTDYL